MDRFLDERLADPHAVAHNVVLHGRILVSKTSPRSVSTSLHTMIPPGCMGLIFDVCGVGLRVWGVGFMVGG